MEWFIKPYAGAGVIAQRALFDRALLPVTARHGGECFHGIGQPSERVLC
jgi:hypothetical protein